MSSSLECRYEERRERVKRKDKVRFPSANLFSPVKRASAGDKVERKQSQKLSGLCIQLEKFSMDTHNILACTSTLFFGAGAGRRLEFKKSNTVYWTHVKSLTCGAKIRTNAHTQTHIMHTHIQTQISTICAALNMSNSKISLG